MWKSASMRPGEQCQMMDGQSVRLVWCADNLAILDSVSSLFAKCMFVFFICVVFVGTCNLPFLSDVQAFSNAAFGQGTGPIYLTNVTCGATEIRLIDCPYSSDVSGLTHANDAGASCSAVRKYLHENNHSEIQLKHIQSFVVCVCVCVCVYFVHSLCL